MCGIVGYIGPQDASPIVLAGLKRLEYRGYDSAGLAVIQDDSIAMLRDVGRLDNLMGLFEDHPISGHIGIGHTRWATHGEPSSRNAHPHMGMNGDVVVVHNGIVENYRELKDELIAEGAVFKSDTDTEVIVHLIERNLNGSLTEAVRKAVSHLRGAHAIVAMSTREPDRLVTTRIGNAGGVAIGLGDGENYIASDIPAILPYTRRMVFLENRQMATVSADGYMVQTLEGEPVLARTSTIDWNPMSAELGEYKHFMQKEIFEQARALTDTVRGRIDFETGAISLTDLSLTPEQAGRINKIVTAACGTSAYSALVGKFMIEELARISVEVDYASEFRYRNPVIDENSVLIAITQSGETVDTLAAIEEAREKGASVWSIVNAIGSQAMRLADGFISMQAGPEIGVASTKAFTTSVMDQYLLALYLGHLLGRLTDDQLRQHARDIARLPDIVGQILEDDSQFAALAVELAGYENFLYLGRGINYPIALEGALKLKEISYIHAEGYPAGEMKHGPIALINENMPTVAIVLKDHVYDKMLSQVEQAKARGGIVIAIATEGDTLIQEQADHVIYIPEVPEMISPMVSVIPLQLLAYHIAVRRGADVDKPRNLAKSVTVE
ncbi:MAG: glutamine--fructose-6-phosphate transaminase (isomerizing) [Anaerolineae bacterium]|nr:glutamine--fructose-6-phosphate transaminase (isomerizing) [Anaerolineae bacterium]